MCHALLAVCQFVTTQYLEFRPAYQQNIPLHNALSFKFLMRFIRYEATQLSYKSKIRLERGNVGCALQGAGM